MHISKIELENIKSHVSSTFNFTRGTTAITGENGAGKTTIIEAVAWVMFDMLDYKKEDFVRRGAKKGSVSITFESGLDEREYIVYRDSGTGYYVTDPRLRTRVADKKEEVFRFLWQHLGLEPGTDLKSLFRQAIGVPQGTLTAIFLEGATERKTAFDRLLKVEEYRQAAEKLRDTSRFLDTSVAGIRETIARAEGELARSTEVTEEHETVLTHVAKLTKEITEIDADLAARQTKVKDLEAKEQRVSGLKTAVERSRAERERAELVLTQATQSVKRASDAAETINRVRLDHEKHVAAIGKLKSLEGKRAKRDHLRNDLAKTEAAIVKAQAEQKRFDDDLKKIAAARDEIETLSPKAAEQIVLEKQITDLRESVTKARGADERIESIDRELGRLRERFKANQEKMRNAETRSASADNVGELAKRDAEIVNELATLKTHLEHDEKFQGEFKGEMCPILSRQLSNENGGHLPDLLAKHLSDVRTRVKELEREHETVTTELAQAREGEKLLAALDCYRQLDAEMKQEGAELNAKKEILDARRRGVDDKKIEQLTTQLRSLADPAARIRILEKEIAREAEIRVNQNQTEIEFKRLDDERKHFENELGTFKELDAEWTRLANERDTSVDAHHSFVANEKDASLLDDRKREAEASKGDLEAKTKAFEAAESDLKAAGVDYDEQLHKKEKAELVAAERRAAESHATLEAKKKREAQIQKEIARFAEIRTSLSGEFQEKERLESVAETTAFIRDTLKEAAPRVARNYVRRVSVEANLMFREIMNTGEQTLKWGDDYSVTLEEDGFERPFASLSGGEQMAAALSIRLALLKQLTDIRVAFFDEPTANMDAERRENLAMQISRITNFDQLFVISHDETFDNFVDHVITVRRNQNENAMPALNLI